MFTCFYFQYIFMFIKNFKTYINNFLIKRLINLQTVSFGQRRKVWDNTLKRSVIQIILKIIDPFNVKTQDQCH